MFLPLKKSLNLAAAFNTFELKAPASPRSPVTSTRSMFCSGRCASSGCLGSPVFSSTRSQRLRPRRQRAFLRTTQLGRRHHLHGLGDLARVFYAANAPPDVAYVRHWVF